MQTQRVSTKPRRRAGGLVTLMLAMALLAGCAGPASVSPVPGVTALPTAGEGQAVLSMYNWDTYIDPAIVAGFEQEYGAEVRYGTYESNEDLLAALEAGATDYDLVVPTDYMVSILRDKKMLAGLDKTQLPNLKNLDPTFISPVFDPDNRYCMPYQWGTLGIGYNIKTVGRELKSWADLFDPQFAGRVSMLDNPRDSLGVTLLFLGFSPNSTNAAEIAKARDFLTSQASQISEYAPDTGQDLLEQGQVDLAFEYSGDIFQLMATNPDIRYVIPTEGSLIWTDSICIPATALHKDLALQFIDYLLRPDIGAALSNYTHYGTPNLAAHSLLAEADRNNPAIYPPPEVREQLFVLADVGLDATQLYDQAWQQVLAAHGQGK